MEGKIWKDRYFDVLKQNQELREETQQLSEQLFQCLQENNNLKVKISQLEEELDSFSSSTSVSPRSLISTFSVKKNSVRSESIFENFFVIEDSITYQFPGVCLFNSEVLPNFAFPSSSNTLPSSMSRKNSFIFTLKSPEDKGRDLLYCCCVQWKSSCYVIVSYETCFDLHFSVLFAYINLTGNFDEQEGLLEEYYFNCKLSEGLVSINLQSAPSIEWVTDDTSNLDIEWTCPVLFSLLNFEGFFRVLCALMQERSIVFVSRNLDNLSSCVLALTGLMRPFKWQHLACPALPEHLSDVLEAPVPLVIGTVLRPKQDSHLIVVDLDQKYIHKRVPSFDVPLHTEMKNTLSKAYKESDINKLALCLQKYWVEIAQGKAKDTEFTRALKDTQFFSCYLNDE